MNQHSISIIVLTYCKFDNLQKNIQSIKAQSFSDYEVIVCDDGSDNFDMLAVEGFCEGIKNITILHNEKNVGTVKNFNNALKASKGKYIVPLAQDDVFFDNNTLQSIYDFFESHNCDTFTAMSIGESSGTIRPLEYEIALLREKDLKKLWMRCALANYISGACMYYRREYLMNKGGFDESMVLLEDYPIIMSQLNEGYIMPIMERPTVIYGEKGVTGGSTTPSHLLLSDSVQTYKKYIIPNENIMHSALNKRIIRWRKHRWENYSSLRKYSIKYLDVLMWCLVTRIESSIKNADCTKVRFESMIRREEI